MFFSYCLIDCSYSLNKRRVDAVSYLFSVIFELEHEPMQTEQFHTYKVQGIQFVLSYIGI